MANKKNTGVCTLNRVDGFNPYDHIEVALDRDGKPIIKKDGEELKYLATSAKETWFRMVYPKGSVIPEMQEVKGINMGYGAIACAVAKVYLDSDTLPVAQATHIEIVDDINDYGKAVAKAQTVAKGKALSSAGFGCEIENNLRLAIEGEAEPEPKESKEVKEPKRTVKAPKAQTPEEKKESEEEVSNLLDMIESEVRKEKEAPAEEPAEEPAEKPAEEDLMEKALNFELKCSAKAPVTVKKLEGMTLREILITHPTFCQLVRDKANIRNAVTEGTAQAADYIANHQ